MTAVPHLGFIVAAYAVTVLVVGGAVAAVLLDGRALRRALERLEARAGRARAGGGR
ncbi:heme exporter protein CcmD [Lichenibacterium dinghuense]|uniref:heme exporter protein CcmD n=1 Tax=Lichenibacterium dinghuense TaxID=2895977 RepID=UPI001EFFC23F|nr:heme exporter protein CcmD [Lichenibacterium sp. 6Y81]